MKRSVVAGLGLATLTLALVGCAGDREMKQKVMTMELRSTKQFGLLKQQNEFMNRKVNALNEKIEELLDANASLSEQFAEFSNLPNEIKIELINEINTRFLNMVNDQKQFKQDLLATVDTRLEEFDQRIDTEFAEMNRVLDHHSEFVEFVSTEQDSINRVFANRIDSRPWYQSIIGKWEDKERAAAENSLQ